MVEAVGQKELERLEEQIEALEKRMKRFEDYPMILEWVTREQAAIILNHTVGTVGRMARRGELPHRKERRKIEFSLKGLIDYKEGHRIKREAPRKRKKKLV